MGVFLLVLGGRALLVQPLRKIDKETAVLKESLEKVKAERRAYFTAEDQVKAFARRTFADQVDQASAKCGEMLTKQILVSGLREADFSRLPVGPRRIRGANEVGWSVQGQGKLTDVIDLLFLLQEAPYLHRIENVTLSQGEGGGHVRVGFRFLTLVLERAPAVDPIKLEPKFNLESDERKLLDGIVARDLLRPYVKRVPDKTSPPPESPAAPSGPASLRIVSLSEWLGESEVHVRDAVQQKTLRFHPGQELAGGTIVMVDYRPMPMPGNEALQSFSRVIVRIGGEYWAIERGQTLADKRRLELGQLPPELNKL